jgi:hypothetical protein
MNQLTSGLLSVLLLGLATSTISPAPLKAQQLPRTWQEENDYRAGPTPFEPLMAFWYEFADMHPSVSIRPLTQTLLDRELTLVSVSSTPITSAEDAIRSGRTIVLIANAVHGGETAGKEASQLIARELIGGELRPLLDDIIVLFIPLVNPDGGEVRRRTNEEGFDMNRDYLKLESQEIHALVTQVMNEWTPDIHVDTHHGGSAPYTLTWQGTLNPAADEELRAFPYEVVFPRIRTALRAADYDGFDYAGAQTRDGTAVWGSTSVEPRKHHVYTGLTNSIGILLETPNNSRRLRNNGAVIEEIPTEERYFHQIQGQYIALREILTIAAESRHEIRALTNGSRERAIHRGMTYEEDDRIVLEYTLESRGREEVWMPNDSLESGYERRAVDVFLEWTPTRTAPRPLGYVLPVSMARVIPMLLDHGITVHRLTEAAALELEVYRATEVRRGVYFQGHYLMQVSADKSTETVEVPAGAFYVSTAQSRGNLISYLLEPETDDNLITWGYANHLLETSETRARNEPQRVPMMRLVREQPMSLLEVVPFNEYSPNRYYQTW